MRKLYHPGIDLIKKYESGELDAGLGLLVKTHLNGCEACRMQAASELEKQADEFFHSSSHVKLTQEDSDDIFNNLFNSIEASEPKLKKPAPGPSKISFHNKVFTLPDTLSFISDKEIHWKEFGQNSAVAQVTSGKAGGLFFIYLGPGETIPKHGHHGREYSYVLDGYYSSDGHKLETGDFSTFEESDTHEPSTTSEDGCLVISWVENRLNFLHGVFAPLNRLLWWYLKRS
ncbi:MULTISPECIES: cupin domain-containing protein [unclassified Halobacteriovorax]|uniref:cupin domain-containing protein n=1 Tax=unclassified Halobacteriovorax TaxID=2639665 RepID=UPI00399B9AF8